jgi:RimJ/RimL family protein N-acetyltransferase
MVSSIDTSHLVLRPLQEEDALALHRIYQSEEVLRYFPNPNPPALEKVQRFILTAVTLGKTWLR